VAAQHVNQDGVASEYLEQPFLDGNKDPATGQESPFAQTERSNPEFIDSNGSVHTILPRWQSDAEHRTVNEVLRRPLPSSGSEPNPLRRQNNMRVAAVPGNTVTEEPERRTYSDCRSRSCAGKHASSQAPDCKIQQSPTETCRSGGIGKEALHRKGVEVGSSSLSRAVGSRWKPPVSPSSSASRPRFVFMRRHLAPQLGFPVRFYPGRAALPLVFHHFPIGLSMWGF
jgi:hypothetical protein